MEAMVLARKAAEAFDSAPRFGVLLAEVFVARGKTARAIEELQAVLKTSPATG